MKHIFAGLKVNCPFSLVVAGFLQLRTGEGRLLRPFSAAANNAFRTGVRTARPSHAMAQAIRTSQAAVANYAQRAEECWQYSRRNFMAPVTEKRSKRYSEEGCNRTA